MHFVDLGGCFILTMRSLFSYLYHYVDVINTCFHANSLHYRLLRLGFSTYYGVMCTPIGEMGVFSSNPALFRLIWSLNGTLIDSGQQLLSCSDMAEDTV